METVLQVLALSLVRITVHKGILGLGLGAKRRALAELTFLLLFDSLWLAVHPLWVGPRSVAVARLLWFIQARRTYWKTSAAATLIACLVSLLEAWTNVWFSPPSLGPLSTDALIAAVFLYRLARPHPRPRWTWSVGNWPDWDYGSYRISKQSIRIYNEDTINGPGGEEQLFPE